MILCRKPSSRLLNGFWKVRLIFHLLLEELSVMYKTVANVPDAETQYHAHEFLDVTVQPKPIYISPNEVYAMHTLLAQHIDFLVCVLQ